ncbi:hypothetical protein GCM10008938_42110 [Deinococcus roseus]|uniref:Uncharacterized protein n=1 Tax=Deinococcus roseus TaxID=392414 RepID=A0ABQ2DAM2_9DEIO|nr:hypothetical protein GCM10008938_42110 [Deinococcus roseus]
MHQVAQQFVVGIVRLMLDPNGFVWMLLNFGFGFSKEHLVLQWDAEWGLGVLTWDMKTLHMQAVSGAAGMWGGMWGRKTSGRFIPSGGNHHQRAWPVQGYTINHPVSFFVLHVRCYVIVITLS